MIRLTVMLALMLPSAAAAYQLALAPPDDTAIRSFLNRTLTTYVVNHDAPSWRTVLTPGLRKLVATNDRLNRGEDSEALGADPICGCQDWKTIRVMKIDVAPQLDGRVKATVELVNFGQSTRVFVLARTSVGWRVDDVLESGRHGLRSALVSDNARLVKSKR